MRTALFVVLAPLVSVAAVDRVPVAAVAGSPCAAATVACTEWVALGRGSARSMIDRRLSLDARNDNIRRAVVMVHGTNRNADHYVTTATAAAFLAGALDDSDGERTGRSSLNARMTRGSRGFASGTRATGSATGSGAI